MKTAMAFLVIVLTTMLFAQNTGTISGKITDKHTGYPISGTNVTVVGEKYSSSSNKAGFYEIKNIPVGIYKLKITHQEYKTKFIKKVKVSANSTSKINIELVNLTKIKEEFEEIIVEPKSRISRKSMMQLGALINGVAGGGVAGIACREAYIPHNTEEYSKIDESGFFEVIQRPLSTFAADVDAASYSNARRFINMDQLPYKDAIRTEEFINYFNYDYKIPKKSPLSINLEYSECPWNEKHNLVHIGLQGKKLAKEEQKASNLVFLLDVSGSMNDPKKLPLLKKSFKMLVEQLKQEDKVAIAVYAGNAGLVLPATPGSEKETIIAALNKLQAGGSTAGGAGIKLAYKVAKENYIKGGNNRVILATDGDFNVGISSTSELVRFIEEKKDIGIFLTVLGFGMGNYKDNRLQELADKGNGNHAYIDNILEAKKVLVNDLTATLFTIAKDVKIQVEFNPAKVKSYRLIGYENRKLEDKDFKDDKKDAGEIGAGHTVTALYEIVPADGQNSSDSYELKYQKTNIKNNAFKTDEILTVKIRYKEPDENKSKEISDVLTGKPIKLDKASKNFRFSASVAQFAMILRNSEFKENSTLESVKKLALSSKGQDTFGYRSEFLNLVDRVIMLKQNN